MDIKSKTIQYSAITKQLNEQYNEFDNWLENFKKTHSNYIELDEYQNKLREYRNDITDNYYRINNIIQSEIDKIDLEKYDITKYINKYIKLRTAKGNDVVMYVDSIERLFDGARFIGPSVLTYEFYDNGNQSTSFLKTSDEYHISVNIIGSTINIITKEEFINTCNQALTNIINKLPNTDE